jgi:hypothetical protein
VRCPGTKKKLEEVAGGAGGAGVAPQPKQRSPAAEKMGNAMDWGGGPRQGRPTVDTGLPVGRRQPD